MNILFKHSIGFIIKNFKNSLTGWLTILFTAIVLLVSSCATEHGATSRSTTKIDKSRIDGRILQEEQWMMKFELNRTDAVDPRGAA